MLEEIVHVGRPRVRKELLEKPLGIRLDEPTIARLRSMATLRQWSLGQTARHLIDSALDRPADTVADKTASYGAPSARGLLLVEEGVGAGQGRLPIIPESDRPYFFREDWLRARGWTPEKPERLVCVKLGPNSIADSMYPTIQPESVLVVDRDPDRSRIEPRSIWLVDLPGEGLLATRLLNGHVSPALIAALLGQRTTRLVGKYSHAEFETLRAAAALGAVPPQVAAKELAVAQRNPAKTGETLRKRKGRGAAPASS